MQMNLWVLVAVPRHRRVKGRNLMKFFLVNSS
jgi:hypothetical protein